MGAKRHSTWRVMGPISTTNLSEPRGAWDFPAVALTLDLMREFEEIYKDHASADTIVDYFIALDGLKNSGHLLPLNRENLASGYGWFIEGRQSTNTPPVSREFVMPNGALNIYNHVVRYKGKDHQLPHFFGGPHEWMSVGDNLWISPGKSTVEETVATLCITEDSTFKTWYEIPIPSKPSQ